MWDYYLCKLLICGAKFTLNTANFQYAVATEQNNLA